MLRLEIVRGAFADCFRGGRLWLVQFSANLLLFVLFVAWLLIPVASNLHLVYNVVFALVIIVSLLTLRAGALNYLSDRQRTEIAPLSAAFRRALRHLIATVLCVAASAKYELQEYAMASPASKSTMEAGCAQSILTPPIHNGRRHSSRRLASIFPASSKAIRTSGFTVDPGLSRLRAAKSKLCAARISPVFTSATSAAPARRFVARSVASCNLSSVAASHASKPAAPTKSSIAASPRLRKYFRIFRPIVQGRRASIFS
jgi:hypothetical protein